MKNTIVILGILLASVPGFSQRGKNNKDPHATMTQFKATLLQTEVKYASVVAHGVVAGKALKSGNPSLDLTVKVSDVMKGDVKPGSRIIVHVPGKPFLKAILEEEPGNSHIFILFLNPDGSYHITFPEDVQPTNATATIKALLR